MAVRYKFRSAVAFDTIDLGDLPSISLGDLRKRIAVRKKLQMCADFDLVLTDADTGQAFEVDDFQIPAGATVVIKRVPAGRAATSEPEVIDGAANKLGRYLENISSSHSKDIELDNLEQSGALRPELKFPVHGFTADVVNMKSNINRKEDNANRVLETSILRCQEGSDLSNASLKENAWENRHNLCDNRGNQKEVCSNEKKEWKKKVAENRDMPVELRCSLCNAIFEEAVMIPCCQHSFCKRCISSALNKQQGCPKCSSTKSSVKDLLPNLSLRQTIKHFLNAQDASYNILHGCALDGESGNQPKELPCAPSIRQQEPVCQDSHSTSGTGSNYIISDPPCNISKMMTDVEVNSSSNFLSRQQKEEAIVPMQRKENEISLTAQVGQGITIPTFKMRKCDRNCYMCDSPDHLIRECPYAKSGNVAFRRGMPPYNQGYWHGASVSDPRSYVNMYGSPGMMCSNPMIYPLPVPLYGGMPTPFGFMRMGAVQSHVMPGAECSVPHTEIMCHPDAVRKHTNKLPERAETCDLSEDYCYEGTVRSHEQRFQPGKQSSPFNVEQRTHRKYSNQKHNSPHQRESYEVKEFHSVGHKPKDHLVWSLEKDQRTRYFEKSNSQFQDISDCFRRHNGVRERNQQFKNNENDSSWKRKHRSQMPVDDELATRPKRLAYIEQDRHSCWQSSQMGKSRNEQFDDHRREMVDGLEEKYREDYRCSKKRRIY